MKARRWLLAAAAVEAGMVHLGRSFGSTPHERHRRLPGDDLVPHPSVVTDHAITIDAPPDAVWPWLVQMGWGRAGWYTARWVDRLLFPANGPSADELRPELQDLAVGDFVPDGAPGTGTGFVVDHLEPPGSMVLHSTTHLPATWRREGRATADWSWSFHLEPVNGGGQTRYHLRSRWRTAPTWLTVGTRLTLVPADFVMARDHLHGVRDRAEGRSAPAPSVAGAG